MAEAPAMAEAPIDLIKAIGHPLRYAILCCVAQGERNVGEIEALTGIGQPTLSQQLSVLRNAGLVTARREAKLVFYEVENSALAQVCGAFQLICPADFRREMVSKMAGDVAPPEAMAELPAPAPAPASSPAASGDADAPGRRRGGAAVFARMDRP
ncbi:ArsR/SmtB family transcription factor [Novosphingobium aureum]|uniref:ArsR/SmtB family transcription factor n=1 Tax=Novosphingobium aureum TaxID=2792964 RepID=UPI001E47A734|nr:metalloregulator ArsR/SmtB family transcription factor [Novosphingobium aureum]